MLTLDKVEAGYGQARVLFGMSLEAKAGEIVSLIGRNGMGKSTTVKSIMGMIKPTGGTVRFGDTVVNRMPPNAIARLGIGLVPEGRRVFSSLSVEENLVATARPGPWTLQRVVQLFPRLEERRRQFARTLSGGEQQMLAIGRALLTNPQLLILDEATEGLAPIIRAEIWRCLHELKISVRPLSSSTRIWRKWPVWLTGTILSTRGAWSGREVPQLLPPTKTSHTAIWGFDDGRFHLSGLRFCGSGCSV